MRFFPFLYLLVAISGLVAATGAGSTGLFTLLDEVQVDDFLASGYKNAVFNSGKYVLRISFASSLNYQQQYRNPDKIKIFRNLQRTWKSKVEEIVRNANISTQPRLFVNKCSDKNITLSNLNYLLTKLVESEDQINNRDIIPLKNAKEERLQQVGASKVSGLEFGTAAPIHEEFIKIPPNNTCAEKSSHSAVCTIDDVDYYLLFEIHPRLGKSLDQLKNEKYHFKENQLIYILVAYLQDQVNMYQSTHHYHVDGHVGNILLADDEKINDEQLSLVWIDFGKSSAISNQSVQMRNSMASLYMFLYESATQVNATRVFQLLDIMWKETDIFNPSKFAEPDTIPRLLNSVKQFVQDNCNVKEIGNISGFSRNMAGFMTNILIDKVEKLDQTVAKQGRDNEDLKAQVSMQGRDIEDLKAQVSKLMLK